MFKLIGVALALYIIQSVSRGEIAVKDGWRWQRVDRGADPGNFWLAIAIYGLLCVALLTVF